MWNLLCHGHGPHIPATIASLCFSGLPRLKGLKRAAAAPTTKPSRRPFQGNSRSYTAQPSVFQGVEAPFARRQTLQTLKPFRKPFQGNSRSYTPQPSVFKGVQDCRLPALNPSTLQTLPQAYPRQLSQLHAPAIWFFRALKLCLPAVKRFKPLNPSAGLSKATLAATRPSHLF